MAEFKDRLDYALNMRNMKASDLARITGIGEGALSQYKKGAYKASQRNLEKIAHALNVSIPWLMGVVDDIGEPTSQFIINATDDDIIILEYLHKLSADQKKVLLPILQALFSQGRPGPASSPGGSEEESP